MAEDYIEQRIAEIEARRGVKSYARHPQDIPWLITQLREAREVIDLATLDNQEYEKANRLYGQRIVELETALHDRDEGLASAGDINMDASEKQRELELDTAAE